MGEEKDMELKMEDLQEQHRPYAELIGIDNLLRLADYVGGTQIYIPKKEELLKSRKYNLIREEFNGNNIKELARKYDVSESTVYRLVRDEILNSRRKQLEGQMSILDFPEYLPDYEK